MYIRSNIKRCKWDYYLHIKHRLNDFKFGFAIPIGDLSEKSLIIMNRVDLTMQLYNINERKNAYKRGESDQDIISNLIVIMIIMSGLGNHIKIINRSHVFQNTAQSFKI